MVLETLRNGNECIFPSGTIPRNDGNMYRIAGIILRNDKNMFRNDENMFTNDENMSRNDGNIKNALHHWLMLSSFSGTKMGALPRQPQFWLQMVRLDQTGLLEFQKARCQSGGSHS